MSEDTDEPSKDAYESSGLQFIDHFDAACVTDSHLIHLYRGYTAQVSWSSELLGTFCLNDDPMQFRLESPADTRLLTPSDESLNVAIKTTSNSSSTHITRFSDRNFTFTVPLDVALGTYIFSVTCLDTSTNATNATSIPNVIVEAVGRNGSVVCIRRDKGSGVPWQYILGPLCACILLVGCSALVMYIRRKKQLKREMKGKSRVEADEDGDDLSLSSTANNDGQDGSSGKRRRKGRKKKIKFFGDVIMEFLMPGPPPEPDNQVCQHVPTYDDFSNSDETTPSAVKSMNEEVPHLDAQTQRIGEKLQRVSTPLTKHDVLHQKSSSGAALCLSDSTLIDTEPGSSTRTSSFDIGTGYTSSDYCQNDKINSDSAQTHLASAMEPSESHSPFFAAPQPKKTSSLLKSPFAAWPSLRTPSDAVPPSVLETGVTDTPSPFAVQLRDTPMAIPQRSKSAPNAATPFDNGLTSSPSPVQSLLNYGPPPRFVGGSSLWRPPRERGARHLVVVSYGGSSAGSQVKSEEDPDECWVVKGEVVVVENYFEDGWCLVRREDPKSLYVLGRDSSVASRVKSVGSRSPSPSPLGRSSTRISETKSLGRNRGKSSEVINLKIDALSAPMFSWTSKRRREASAADTDDAIDQTIDFICDPNISASERIRGVIPYSCLLALTDDFVLLPKKN